MSLTLTSRSLSHRGSSEHTSHSTRSRNERDVKKSRTRRLFGSGSPQTPSEVEVSMPSRHHTLHDTSRNVPRQASFRRSLHAVRHSLHSLGRTERKRTKSKDPSKAALRKAGGKFARKTCDKAFQKSQYEDKSDDFPKFKFKEVYLGKVLGKGGFGTVREVRFLAVDNDAQVLDVSSSIIRARVERRRFLAEHCFRSDGRARYAVKYLRQSVLNDPARFIQGVTDMAIETRFLSTVEHPHIIKMRGVSDEDRYGEKHFILIDRLHGTLEKKIEKWGKKTRRAEGIVAKVADPGGNRKFALLDERVLVAYQVASALNYLHDRKIIYRDVKSENIGFDGRGDIKLFDFGLAKEITPDIEARKNSKGLYRLTGDTGSLRYMAPEVSKGLPYNEKCDVYSFSILVWEILACRTPFELYSPSSIKENVHSGIKRPQISERWPARLKLLLQLGWTSDIKLRNTMKDMKHMIKQELLRLRDGDETGLDLMGCASIFAFDEDEGNDLLNENSCNVHHNDGIPAEVYNGEAASTSFGTKPNGAKPSLSSSGSPFQSAGVIVGHVVEIASPTEQGATATNMVVASTHDLSRHISRAQELDLLSAVRNTSTVTSMASQATDESRLLPIPMEAIEKSQLQTTGQQRNSTLATTKVLKPMIASPDDSQPELSFRQYSPVDSRTTEMKKKTKKAKKDKSRKKHKKELKKATRSKRADMGRDNGDAIMPGSSCRRLESDDESSRRHNHVLLSSSSVVSGHW